MHSNYIFFCSWSAVPFCSLAASTYLNIPVVRLMFLVLQTLLQHENIELSEVPPDDVHQEVPLIVYCVLTPLFVILLNSRPSPSWTLIVFLKRQRTLVFSDVHPFSMFWIWKHSFGSEGLHPTTFPVPA